MLYVLGRPFLHSRGVMSKEGTSNQLTIPEFGREEALGQLRSLMDSEAMEWFLLGRVLHSYRKNNPASEFDSMLEEAGKFSPVTRRKAYYLIHIYESLEASGITYDEVAGVGWTKLKEIAHLLTKDTVSYWVALAKEHTVKELVALSKTPIPTGMQQTLLGELSAPTLAVANTQTVAPEEPPQAPIDGGVGGTVEAPPEAPAGPLSGGVELVETPPGVSSSGGGVLSGVDGPSSEAPQTTAMVGSGTAVVDAQPPLAINSTPDFPAVVEPPWEAGGGAEEAPVADALLDGVVEASAGLPEVSPGDLLPQVDEAALSEVVARLKVESLDVIITTFNTTFPHLSLVFEDAHG